MADFLKSASNPEPKAPLGFTIGVLSDTHIPDRKRELDPRITRAFQQASVDLIFHAGDISTQVVLDQLGELAPVQAVRGNRDWMMLRHLPSVITMEIHGVRLALAHGHGSLANYILDRLYYYQHGFHIERYLPRLLSTFTTSDVIVFGHIHRPICQMIDGQFVFNPGSAHVPDPPYKPSVGMIRIYSNGEFQATHIQLEDVISMATQIR